MRDLLLHMEEISILRAPQLCYFNSSRAALFLSDRDIWHRLWSCYWTLMPIRITVNRSSSSRERTGDITLGPAHKNTFQITCDNKRQRLTENTKSTNGEHCVVTTSIERGGRTRASQEMCNKSICVKLSLRCRHTHELAWWEVSMEFHGCCKNQKKKSQTKATKFTSWTSPIQACRLFQFSTSSLTIWRNEKKNSFLSARETDNDFKDGISLYLRAAAWQSMTADCR